jgi:hypothetical protein
MGNRNVFIVFAMLSGFATPGLGHHSISAEYDMHSTGTIEGVVTEVWFNNPHVRYYLSVADDEGNEVIWNTHGHNPVTLVRTGWMRETIQVGDRIAITGDTTRNGSPKLFIRKVTLADGRVLISHPGADNAAR